ncbi:uncharacterized protein CLAFUR5_09313 [Fulvia fulva]|uniref:Uncharacterized protein n=1 Tax=Passalora fulva TaxID=5499 RepID=A0A9Q8PGL0_PASFU|nr:uncharacterized protein CLAFUR5_09313 [Fulvia fulva]UJO22027.1 hypothetical protein CLAFUR5_09313 [Fulvia fulva]
MAGPDAAVAIRSFAKAKLHLDYPYMPVAAIEELLDRCETDTKAVIEKQKPVMVEIKSRVSFFSLPAELRNVIYELATTPGPDSSVKEEQHARRHCSPNIPAIIQSSQRLRNEALPIYYGMNSFKVYFCCIRESQVRYFDILQTQEWLRSIGKTSAAMIKKFGIEVEVEAAVRSSHHMFGALCARLGCTEQQLTDGVTPGKWNQDLLRKALPTALTELGIAEGSIKFQIKEW